MTVLVADKLPDQHRTALEEQKCSVVYEPELKGDALIEAMRSHTPDILIVRSTKVPRAVIEAHPGLNVVIRAGAGYNTIDVEAASARSVYVANTPGKNSVAVAELAFGLLLSLDRRIPDNVSDLRNGVWNKQEYSKAEGIYGQTLGVVGLGKIGVEMVHRAKSFGMKVVAWSRSLSTERAESLGVRRLGSPEEVAGHADAVSVHLAANADTKNLISEQFFAQMKPGAYFINTSRAEVVDEAALQQAIKDKGIRAGLDVFSQEPSGKSGAVTAPLFDEPVVYGTHHIGASTEQAQNAVADEVVRIVGSYLESGQVPNCVNTARRTPARYILSVHHRNRVGVLASVLTVIKENNINVNSMENVLFEGGEGACANIQIEAALSETAMRKLEASSDEVLSVNMHEIG